MTFEEWWKSNFGSATRGFPVARLAWSASRQAAIEEAMWAMCYWCREHAPIENGVHIHKTPTRLTTRPCTASPIRRALARPDPDCSGCGKVDGEMHNYDCPEAQD